MKVRGLIVAMTVGLTALAAGSVAMAAPRTSARIYRAFTSSGGSTIQVTKTVKGHCFSGSLAANRNDAWRCLSKNLLYDPCFSSSKASGIVLCPAAAWRRSGVKIILTSGLPTKFANKHSPSTNVRPWAMETFSAIKCSAFTGTAPAFDGHAGRYGCTNGKVLWDTPSRTTNPWTIYMAPENATVLTTKVRIWIAWF